MIFLNLGVGKRSRRERIETVGRLGGFSVSVGGRGKGKKNGKRKNFFQKKINKEKENCFVCFFFNFKEKSATLTTFYLFMG